MTWSIAMFLYRETYAYWKIVCAKILNISFHKLSYTFILLQPAIVWKLLCFNVCIIWFFLFMPTYIKFWFMFSLNKRFGPLCSVWLCAKGIAAPTATTANHVAAAAANLRYKSWLPDILALGLGPADMFSAFAFALSPRRSVKSSHELVERCPSYDLSMRVCVCVWLEKRGLSARRAVASLTLALFAYALCMHLYVYVYVRVRMRVRVLRTQSRINCWMCNALVCCWLTME